MATESQEFREITRIADQDVAGSMLITHAMTKVKGVSFMFANAVSSALKLDKSRKVGYFSPDEIKKIEDCMRNPSKYGIPAWIFNRRKDRETGKNKHLISSDLELAKKFDIREMQKIKSYRGVRHSMGAKKVRGQKTKATGRKGKTLGVQRKKKSGKK